MNYTKLKNKVNSGLVDFIYIKTIGKQDNTKIKNSYSLKDDKYFILDIDDYKNYDADKILLILQSNSNKKIIILGRTMNLDKFEKLSKSIKDKYYVNPTPKSFVSEFNRLFLDLCLEKWKKIEDLIINLEIKKDNIKGNNEIKKYYAEIKDFVIKNYISLSNQIKYETNEAKNNNYKILEIDDTKQKIAKVFNVNEVYVYIFSWKKVTENAIKLYKKVIERFPNTYFLNCDENYSVNPIDIDSSKVIQLNDDYYYGGQFETVINHIPDGKYLGILTGDVYPDADWFWILQRMTKAFYLGNIGIYAPNVFYTTKTKQGKEVSKNLYEVPNTDCTCWFLHPNVYKKLQDIPIMAISNISWGVDEICISESKKQNKLVVRDYEVLVRQPYLTGYNKTLAILQMNMLHEIYDKLKN